MIDLMRMGLPRLVEFEDGGVTHRWVLLYWIMRASRDGWSVYLAVDPLAPMPAPVVMTTAPDNARTLPVVNGEIAAADPPTTKDPK